MKKLALFTLFTALCLVLDGQSKQQVIATAGGYKLTGDAISLSWTLGETIIPTTTSSDGALILTHGFQQTLIITTIGEEIPNPVSVIVYPNPATEKISIRFETPVVGEVNIVMADGNGKIVKAGVIPDSTVEYELILSDMKPGVYFLRLIKGNHINVYRVVKL